MNIKPLFYFYPTKIYLVDDNLRFLENLQLSLPGFNTQIETKLDQALTHIKANQAEQIKLFHQLIKPDEALQLDNDLDEYGSHVSYSLDKIKQIMNKKTRFDDISVIVIDYAMPGMNGVKFCEALNGLPIKKIMLTGEADHQLAIDAFNRKIIDGFVSKNSKTLYEELRQMIRDLQKEYFYCLQQRLIDGVEANLAGENIIDEYNQLVEKLTLQYNIKEYYLTDSKGSCVMFDNGDNKHYLQIYSVGELDMYHDIALNSDESKSLINDLAERKKAPFFMDRDENYLHVSEWQAHLRDIIPFKEGKGFYYSVI